MDWAGTASPTAERLNSLKELGFSIALDDHLYSPAFTAFYQLVDIVRLDVLEIPPDELPGVVQNLRAFPLTLLAENSEGYRNLCKLVTRGKVRRAHLGIAGQVRPLHRRVQRYFELKTTSGVEVMSVEENGPAARSGLLVGDVIIGLDGQEVATVDDIHRLLTRQPENRQFTLTILRGTERRDVQVSPTFH